MNLDGVRADSISKPPFAKFSIMQVVTIATTIIASVIVEPGCSGLLAVGGPFHSIRIFV